MSDEELVAALRAKRWEPGSTAEHLGISRAALYLLIDACPHTRKASDLERSEIEVSEEGLKRHMKKLGLRSSSPQLR